jgi:hypothetical protein
MKANKALVEGVFSFLRYFCLAGIDPEIVVRSKDGRTDGLALTLFFMLFLGNVRSKFKCLFGLHAHDTTYRYIMMHASDANYYQQREKKREPHGTSCPVVQYGSLRTVPSRSTRHDNKPRHSQDNGPEQVCLKTHYCTNTAVIPYHLNLLQSTKNTHTHLDC